MGSNSHSQFKEAVLDFLRQQSYIPFWESQIVRTMDEREAAAFLGLPEQDYFERQRALQALEKISFDEFSSFSIAFKKIR